MSELTEYVESNLTTTKKKMIGYLMCATVLGIFLIISFILSVMAYQKINHSPIPINPISPI